MKTARKRINGRQKGAAGEREAARYLTKLGFPCVREARNGLSASDLRFEPGVLDNVHIEVKREQAMDLHTKSLGEALLQAAKKARECGRTTCAVLWRRNNVPWRLTLAALNPDRVFTFTITVCGDDRIRQVLKDMNEKPSN